MFSGSGYTIINILLVQVIRALNNGGVCLSYDATWQILRRLIHEAGYLDMIREGHWLWIYDNLNFSRKVRRERSGLCVKN